MTNYQIDATYDLYKLINILKKSEDSDITFLFIEDALLYKNSSNLVALKKIAQENAKVLTFEAKNPDHKDYIDNMNSGILDLSSNEVELADMDKIPKGKFRNASRPKMQLRVPRVNFSGFGFLTALSPKSGLIKVVAALVIIVGLLVGGAWAFINYIPKANVKIKLDSQVLVKLLDVNARLDTKVASAETASIPAFNISVTETDSQTIPTTGKKDTGDKATGKVIIINWTTDSIKIKKGTFIKQKDKKDNALRFLLNDDVKVGAMVETTDNSDPANPKKIQTPGKSDVKVTAENFGDNYNLDKDNKFDISGYKNDDASAQNSDKLSGGSKTQVGVVAQADIDLIKKSMDDFMKNKIKESLNKKIVGGQKLSETSITYNPTNAQFSAILDAEEKDLTLTMTYEGTGLAYDKSDLDKIVVDLAKKVVPDSFDLSKSDPDYEAVGVKDPNLAGVLNIQVKLRSYIMPRLDKIKVKSDLAGMKLSDAQAYLNKLPNVQEITIEVTPQLPAALLSMPKRSENINIDVVQN